MLAIIVDHPRRDLPSIVKLSTFNITHKYQRCCIGAVVLYRPISFIKVI